MVFFPLEPIPPEVLMYLNTSPPCYSFSIFILLLSEKGDFKAAQTKLINQVEGKVTTTCYIVKYMCSNIHLPVHTNSYTLMRLSFSPFDIKCH